MYTLHVHAVISQLMTLFVPTYSTTNLEIPQNIRFKLFLHVQHTYSYLVLFSLMIFLQTSLLAVQLSNRSNERPRCIKSNGKAL